MQSRRPDDAFDTALHSGIDDSDVADYWLQSVSFGGAATVPLDVADNGSLAIKGIGHDGNDCQHAWRTPRKHHPSSREIAAHRGNQLPSEPYQGAGSSEAGVM